MAKTLQSRHRGTCFSPVVPARMETGNARIAKDCTLPTTLIGSWLNRISCARSIGSRSGVTYPRERGGSHRLH